jgi:signal-transduction protein with cAMP-binding, CBS, and nucleotidyltransferase domain
MTQTATVASIRDTDLSKRRLEPILTIDQYETVAAAARLMADYEVGCLVVLGNNRQVAGIVSERDIITKVVARRADPNHLAVYRIMSRNVVSCQMHTRLDQVRRMMSAHNVRHLPVIEDGAPLGMVSIRDLMAYEIQHWQSVANEQSQILEDIERQHPEMVHWRRDNSGRVVIS